ncbi:MAG TPA: NAD(P)H-dependent glycerol-3-phosphate dehydrogenase [Xanthobacteraceae bacterium]|jgi:glycerol-3-phosphate dehydrogenase (NAD(P)+)
MTFDRIAVIGAGAWGIALAKALSRAGRTVLLCARDRRSADRLRDERESARLSGIRLDDHVVIAALDAGLSSHDPILMAIPAQDMRAAALRIAPALKQGATVIACAKGIERRTGKFMTEVLAEALPAAIPAVLSGPSFAHDVARGLPTALTLATRVDERASALASALGSVTFRPYHSTDVRGVEIGGAAKNVLAIAAGIVAGRALGASAAAAVITRGFAELFRFGEAYGARPETLTGLSGLGDVVLTCSSPKSRNYSFGVALGKGQAADPASIGGKLVEGLFTAGVLVQMAEERGIEMPIARSVDAIITGRTTVDEAIDSLLTRPFRAEGWQL